MSSLEPSQSAEVAEAQEHVLEGGLGWQGRGARGEGGREPVTRQLADALDAVLWSQAAETPPNTPVPRQRVAHIERASVMRQRGDEHRASCKTVVAIPARYVVGPAHSVEEPLARLLIVTKQDWK